MKVSILCGVYNAEKTIRRLVDSLIAQTYLDIEIIMVVNATNDSSESVLKEYDDSRLKVFCTSEKLGAGGARQKAFELSTGEYIAVVDCDDYVGRDYILNMVKTLEKEKNADIVFSGFCRVDQKGRIAYTRGYKECSSALYQSVAPWAKMYRREFLLLNGLEFVNVPFGEDVIFTAGVIMAKPSMTMVEDADYFWTDNPMSTSHSEIRYFPTGNLLVAENLFDKYISYFQPQNSEGAYLVYKYLIWYLLQSGRNVGRKKMAEEYLHAMDYLSSRYPNWESECLSVLKNDFGERKVVVHVLKILIRLRKVKLCRLFLEIYSCLPMDKFWPSL